jgi:hypothetical protein
MSIIDISKTISPKSDQLNADDLITGPITAKIIGVSITETKDQPVSINLEGFPGKPFKPCKSMRRVLVSCWGNDGNLYVGRSITLYRDDRVTWAGQEVGGIRISHLSHIDREVNLMLTASRSNRKPFRVRPLSEEHDDNVVLRKWAEEYAAQIKAATSKEYLEELEGQNDDMMIPLLGVFPKFHSRIMELLNSKREEFVNEGRHDN